MKPYLQSAEYVLKDQGTTTEGLSKEEASKRLLEYGPNKLAEGKKVPLVMRFLEQLKDPMTIILIAAAIVSGITAVYSGEEFVDVIIILLVVIINAVLGVVQESKAEKSIEALQEITAASSKVMRDGYQVTVKSEELVPGDIIVIEAGDSIPADARIIESASMKVEESALTGESVPVNKVADKLQGDPSLGDRKNMVYMGSTLVYGRGLAVVTGTGMSTEMGKIADSLANAVEEQTPLQRKLSQLGKTLSVIVLGICVFIFGLNMIRMYPNITGTGIIDTFMTAVSLAVAAIPEGLATVVTVVLSIGVTNMSRRKAVIRKLTAVETLGCAQVVCSDKTGTLTQNKMTVTEYKGASERSVAKALAMCSDAKIDDTGEAVGEPTECALVNYCSKVGLNKVELEAKQPRVGEAPFDSMRKMMSTVHRCEDGTFVQYTKGAVDEVLKNCVSMWDGREMVPLTDEIRKSIMSSNKGMADRALRVLCAAMRDWETEPSNYTPEYLEQELCYVGIVGMIDPVRPEVKDAIVECREAGIRPVMITGDHKDTAVAIAMELGIITDASQAITGAELDFISDDNFMSDVEKYSVYARVQPEHKVRIVKAWKSKGMITAMTGDGVNDAPSIKNADIGIGMGITGTDVTKNVADMVLADDNFATIVSAVGEGRRIYDNIRKSIQFLLASNLAEVLAIFFATLMGFTILEPVNLLWINLITDCFPALALGMEEAEDDVMKRKPRDAKDGIFSGGLGFNVVFQGVMVTVLTLAAYFIGCYLEAGNWCIMQSKVGMTMAFLTLSMSEVVHSLNMRSIDKSIFRLKTHNKFLFGAMTLSALATVVVLCVPALSSAFSLVALPSSGWIAAGLLAVSVIPIVEAMKAIRRYK